MCLAPEIMFQVADQSVGHISVLRTCQRGCTLRLWTCKPGSIVPLADARALTEGVTCRSTHQLLAAGVACAPRKSR